MSFLLVARWFPLLAFVSGIHKPALLRVEDKAVQPHGEVDNLPKQQLVKEHQSPEAGNKTTDAVTNLEKDGNNQTHSPFEPATRMDLGISVGTVGDTTVDKSKDPEKYFLPGANTSAPNELWLDPSLPNGDTLSVSQKTCTDFETKVESKTFCQDIPAWTDSPTTVSHAGGYGHGGWAFVMQPMSMTMENGVLTGAEEVRFHVGVTSQVAVCQQEPTEDFEKVEARNLWQGRGFEEDTNRKGPTFSDDMTHMARCYVKHAEAPGLVTLPRSEKTITLVRAKPL